MQLYKNEWIIIHPSIHRLCVINIKGRKTSSPWCLEVVDVLFVLYTESVDIAADDMVIEIA